MNMQTGKLAGRSTERQVYRQIYKQEDRKKGTVWYSQTTYLENIIKMKNLR